MKTFIWLAFMCALSLFSYSLGILNDKQYDRGYLAGQLSGELMERNRLEDTLKVMLD